MYSDSYFSGTALVVDGGLLAKLPLPGGVILAASIVGGSCFEG